MHTKRIKTIRKKLKEGRCDGPETITAGACDLAKELIGRRHAKETQLRWVKMDIK
jgi:hypothetical protein